MAVAKERVTQATEYLVLEQRELKDPKDDSTVVAWVEVGTASATTRTGAAGEVAGDREGVWRAVPTRNWGDGAIRTREEVTKKMKVEVVEPF
jgi:hypothetical protein